MPLNEELNWAQVGAIVTDKDAVPPTVVAQAFQLAYGEPTKDLLPAAMRLYKFNSHANMGRGTITEASVISPWWSPAAPYRHDAGLVQRQKIADANGVSFREWGRLTSVIKENWGSLDWLWTLELAVPVYAWFGGFKSMARIDKDAVSSRNAALEGKGIGTKLPGGGTQFYIPNLTVSCIRGSAFRAL